MMQAQDLKKNKEDFGIGRETTEQEQNVLLLVGSTQATMHRTLSLLRYRMTKACLSPPQKLTEPTNVTDLILFILDRGGSGDSRQEEPACIWWIHAPALSSS